MKMSPAQIGLTTHVPWIAGRERPAPKGGPRDAESLKHLPLDLPSYARELRKHLKDDPMEKNNVLSGHPELAGRLRSKLEKWLTGVNARMPRK